MKLYRCDRAGAEDGNPHRRQPTRRAPGNVPYLVDNLWEWARPTDRPNRRHSVFASPSPALCAEYAHSTDCLYLVVPRGRFTAVQIEDRDASRHHDCKQLTRALADCLRPQGWLDQPIQAKQPTAALWAPCLSKEEVETLFQLEPLAKMRDAIRQEITLWSSAAALDPAKPLPFAEGEVFFAAEEWDLTPVPR